MVKAKLLIYRVLTWCIILNYLLVQNVFHLCHLAPGSVPYEDIDDILSNEAAIYSVLCKSSAASVVPSWGPSLIMR